MGKLRRLRHYKDFQSPPGLIFRAPITSLFFCLNIIKQQLDCEYQLAIMKLSIAALGLLASAVVAAPLEERAKPLVQSVSSCLSNDNVLSNAVQNKLRRVLLRSNLLAKSSTLERFAYATLQKNRLIGNPGHQATIDYLVATTSSLDYYNVTTQAFQVPSGVTTLTVGGTVYHSDIMTLSPGGHPVAPVVAVPNLGCDAVSLQMPPVYTPSKIQSR